MTIVRATMTWSGFTGAPGYTNLHFQTTGSVTSTLLNETMANARTLFVPLGLRMPTGVNITFPTTMDEFDETSGELLNTRAVTLQSAVTGAGGTTAYSSAAGACMSWQTDSIVNGRRLRGRTFLVPLNPAAAFENNGTLLETARVALLGGGSDLVTSTDGYPFCIWHQPEPGATNGAAGVVTGWSMADKTAILRSRRD